MDMVYQINEKKKKTKNLSHCWIIHFFIVTDSFHCWNYCVISTNNFESGDDHSSINMHYQFTVNNCWYLQFERFKDWTDNIIHNFWKNFFLWWLVQHFHIFRQERMTGFTVQVLHLKFFHDKGEEVGLTTSYDKVFMSL